MQDAIRKRAGEKIEGGKIIKIEAHPIPENYRPRRVVGRMALVGDAAGYVTKCSGEGIYFAAKSGRMAAEAVVQCIKQTGKLPTEAQLKKTYLKDYDKLYKPTYLVLDILQKVKFGWSPPNMEACVYFESGRVFALVQNNTREHQTVCDLGSVLVWILDGT